MAFLLSARTFLPLVVVLAVTGACSTDVPSPEAHRVKSEADLILPLDAYDLNGVERSIVQSARYRLIERCLSDFGLSFRPHDTKPVAYPKNASYLGWLGAKQVGTYGYSGPRGQARGGSGGGEWDSRLFNPAEPGSSAGWDGEEVPWQNRAA
ncbi:hypothetical protein ACGFI3_08810 [Nonomuraea wenchangensis]|uniref:hypothetical protein n=1 Tax=Nonomuraea wenchangensis TaxID=568860 RepID=UPI00371F1173